MAFIVPTFQSTSASYTIEANLNNEAFKLNFTWNQRESSWYMDILDIDENHILSGIKLVSSYLLIRQYNAIPNLPKGDFYIVDLNDDPDTGNVSFDEFGKRFQLIFYTEEELNGI